MSPHYNSGWVYDGMCPLENVETLGTAVTYDICILQESKRGESFCCSLRNLSSCQLLYMNATIIIYETCLRVSWNCEKWSVALVAEHSLLVFQNYVLGY
jgi:hypothetical protein